MTRRQWFSTRIRLACLIEGSGLHRYADSIFVFRSADFDAAFQKALDIGKSLEQAYRNDDQQLVEWKLKEVISLDVIAEDFLDDGVEVYSEPIAPSSGEIIPFGCKFHPAISKPIQTI